MGLFNLFKSKSGVGGEKRANSAASKWADTAGNKRAQAYDRQEAIAELCKMGTAEAAEGLMRRFSFAIDPSITDQEEKDAAFEGVVAAGHVAIEPVRAFVAKAESLAWPMRIMKELMTDDQLVEEYITWLSRWDTEYSKFVDPKLQILAELEEYEHPSIREAVEPFLQDVNEPARFHAVAATFAQRDPASIPLLVNALIDDESVRVRIKIADTFASLGWEIPADKRAAVRDALPPQFDLVRSGKITKQ
ncbi:MAG: HEAT repeat domain-containing protein [Polyangiaceae bacterium]|nr:HEAT repeat domain-containing protein [Polyangiaceae bacterium]